MRRWMWPFAPALTFLVTGVVAMAQAPTDAARRSGRPPVRRAAPVRAPAQPADFNHRALQGFGFFGRDCPERRSPRSVADWTKPLQFVLVPDAGRGAPVLLVGGRFTEGDADRLRSFLATAGPVGEVQLDSGGGDAAEGPKVGRVIRAAGLSTRVGRDFACISSCSVAFLGGVLRRVDPGAIFGVHAFYSATLLDSLAALKGEAAMRNYLHVREQGNAILAGQIQQYGQEMGISRQFFTEVMFSQRSEVFIGDAELGRLRAMLTRPLSDAQAIATTRKLIEDGVIRTQSEQERAFAARLAQWMTAAHDQQEVDTVLASLLSNDFRCPSAQQLEQYNITNVVDPGHRSDVVRRVPR